MLINLSKLIALCGFTTSLVQSCSKVFWCKKKVVVFDMWSTTSHLYDTLFRIIMRKKCGEYVQGVFFLVVSSCFQFQSCVVLQIFKRRLQFSVTVAGQKNLDVKVRLYFGYLKNNVKFFDPSLKYSSDFNNISVCSFKVMAETNQRGQCGLLHFMII